MRGWGKEGRKLLNREGKYEKTDRPFGGPAREISKRNKERKKTVSAFVQPHPLIRLLYQNTAPTASKMSSSSSSTGMMMEAVPSDTHAHTHANTTLVSDLGGSRLGSG